MIEPPFSDPALDMMEEVFFAFTPGGKIVQWNRRVNEVTGYSDEEIASMHPAEFVPARERGLIERHIKEALEEGQTRLEAHFRTKEGEEVPYEFTGSLIEREEQTLICGTGRDISRRKRAEEELKASEKRYRFLAETAVDAIVVGNEEGEIIDWNRGAEEIFGYEEEEILGRPIETLMPERHKKPHRRGMERVRQTGEGRYLGETIELEGLRKSGEEFPLELSLSSWTVDSNREEDEERYFAAIIRDITGRRELQREVLRIQEEERRRIGQDLHDGAASQLTGANIKLNLLARMAEGGLSEGEATKSIEEIQELIDEGIADVRRLSRGLSPRGLAEGDLVSALEELAKNTEGARLEDRQGALDLEESDLEEGGATHLYRIAQEAVNNARKYAEASEILIRLHQANGTTKLEVKDNGKGFDPGEISEGLGLRSMRHRAEFLGAELSVESAPGKGTLVRCRLPT